MELQRKIHKIQRRIFYFSIMTLIFAILFFTWIVMQNFNRMQNVEYSVLSAQSETTTRVINSAQKVYSRMQNYQIENFEFLVFVENLIQKAEICFIAVFDEYGKFRFIRESDKCRGVGTFATQYIAENKRIGRKIIEWKGKSIYLEINSANYAGKFSESDMRKKLVRNVRWDNPSDALVAVGLGAQIYQNALSRDNLFLVMAAFLALASSVLGLAVVKWRRQVSKFESIACEKIYMRSLATLAGGMAHEVRNPLSTIKGFGAYFSTKFEIGSRERALLNEMDGDIDRLNRIISEFLELTNLSD
jgi:two-component system sensor histidine kinase HydH